MKLSRVTRHTSEIGCWEMVVAEPHPGLRGYVREYVAGVENTVSSLVRRELPTEIAPVIINFGPPFRLFDQHDSSRFNQITSFVAGAFDSYVLVGATGAYACVQVNFTLMGLRAFLGRPIGDLCNRVVALDQVFGSAADRLVTELYEAPTWDARFEILDREIHARIARGKGAPPSVLWAWRRLARTAGRVSIGTLVDEVGCSQRHLIAQFTDEIGLTPKVIARVLRFGRAAELLKTADGMGLAAIAHECGYYDQAHFTRDFRAFAGITPTELLASELPDRGGYAVR